MPTLPAFRSRRLARLLVVAAAVGLLAAVPVAAEDSALAPFDYATIEPTLTQPTHQVAPREVVRVPMHDGVKLYVEVVKPVGEGPFPVILEASPYHGTLADRDGTRILPDPRDAANKSIGLTGYFAPRGYAVVMADLRGTGRSQGCLDHLGQNDAKDLKAIVEWAAAQPWSNGRVGMTGHSYVGSTPMVAAAQNPKGLVTIVPSAGLASMYDHQFQAGVPYNLQWAGPQFAYEAMAIGRHLPAGFNTILAGPTGDNFGNDMTDFGCGLPTSSLTAGEAQLSGQYTTWHAQRDWAKGATAAAIPMFLWHGVNDNAARVTAAQWFFDRNGRAGDKLWLGQWDHGSGFAPTRRGMNATYAMHAWFDKHLAQRDVQTGPPVEIFLNDAGTLATARRDEASKFAIATSDGWDNDGDRTLALFPAADGSMTSTAPAAGSRAFAGDPRGQVTSTNGLSYETAPVTQDTLLAGMPQLDLVASVTSPRVHLIATLFDKNKSGELRRITQFAINPELRFGVATPTPVIPGQRMELHPPAMAMGHELAAGHSLVLRITTSDPDKVATFAVDPQITVFSGTGGTALRVPVETSTVYDDPIK